MLSIFGQSRNWHETPTILGVRYNRASLDWRTKPWSCQFINNVITRFEVRPGDRGYTGDVGNGNERSELVTMDQAGQNLLFGFGEDGWLAYGLMVPDDGVAITAPFTIAGQLHDFHDPADTIGLSPPLCFVLGTSTGNTVPLSLQTRVDKNPASSTQPPATSRWSATITRGVWYHIVCRFRCGYNDDAQLQLWVNGVEQTNLSGVNIGFNHSTGGAAGYWQNGIYRGQSANTGVVFYANMEQGKSSLLARVASPLPIGLQ